MEHVNCPVCGSDRAEALWSKLGALYGRCTTCGLVYENPRLSKEELRAFYSEEGYYIQKEPAALVVGYQNYFAQCSPALIEEYYQIMVRAAGDWHGKHLDLGCGTGGLVARARQEGWDAIGQEISAWASAQARVAGVPVIEGPLEEANLEAASFEAVTMFDVLEHLPAPVPTLQEIRRILKPGGVLVIETPNVDGWFARNLYHEHSDLVKPRAHICLYSPASVRAMFERVPFRTVTITTFPWCRRYSYTYFKALIASRVMPGRVPVQLTWNESLRIIAAT